MHYYILVFLAAFGLIINLSFSGSVSQPDWCLSFLLGILLSKRETWYWTLPLIGLHDLILFWSVWVTFPFSLLVAVILNYSDTRLAPGQPQRWLGVFLGCLPLLFFGIDWVSWLLTVSLTIWVWFGLSARKEKAYVEPT